MTSTTQQTIDRALAAAGLRPGPSKVREIIDAALVAAGLRLPHAARAPADHGRSEPVLLREVDRVHVPVGATDNEAAGEGHFTSRVHRHAHGSLAYKLFVPAGSAGEPRPMLVMLHGCKQNPDDFAAGTRMNELAQRHGFLVAYPEQAARANGGKCWNWFEPAQQGADGSEPASIVGMVREIARAHAVDPAKVFVAGLSAGAAMAVVLGATHPQTFAGVAAHSGLPFASGHDVASAFAAMRGQPQLQTAGPRTNLPAVRTIVFHGDADPTVAASNGQAVVTQAVRGFAQAGTALRALPPVAGAAGGRSFARTDHVTDAGIVQVSDWVVRGGGHTWFGGSPQGSYVDAGGPDASAEIVRFFLAPQA